MNEFERSYQHYLRHKDQRERKRLRSAAWAKAHPGYWIARRIKPFEYLFHTPTADLEGWMARIRQDIIKATGVPASDGSRSTQPDESCYLWVKQPHPTSKIPERPFGWRIPTVAK